MFREMEEWLIISSIYFYDFFFFFVIIYIYIQFIKTSRKLCTDDKNDVDNDERQSLLFVRVESSFETLFFFFFFFFYRYPWLSITR